MPSSACTCTRPPSSPLFPYTTLFRSDPQITGLSEMPGLDGRHNYDRDSLAADLGLARDDPVLAQAAQAYLAAAREEFWREAARLARRDRKSTRLNSSHTVISYAVFCLHVHAPPQLSTLSLHDALPI